MSRIIAIGLTALMLAACQPADKAAAPVEPVAAAAPAENVGRADAAWAATQDRYRQMETAPSDPVEAVEWRAVLCSHMSGEFGGDNSERDRSLNARMDELRCGDELAADTRALSTARAADPAVVARLAAVLAFSQP